MLTLSFSKKSSGTVTSFSLLMIRRYTPQRITGNFISETSTMVMEALHRPGHFNGVAQVVSRLFDIVKPDIAFFGMKDFQQLAVIKELVRQTASKVKITGCPIIREKDGLAMSSRNTLLEPDIRKNAPVIFRTISTASSMIREYDIAEIKSFVKETINKVPGLMLNILILQMIQNLFLYPSNLK